MCNNSFPYCFLVGVLVCANCLLSTNNTAQGQLTKNHEILERFVGTWEVTLKSWTYAGIKKPLEFKGTETNSMLGKNWLIRDLELPEIIEDGIYLKRTFGYSPVDKKYRGQMIIVFSPYERFEEGTFDSKSNSFTLMTTSREISRGAKTEGKIVLTFVDDDTRSETIYRKNLDTGKYRKTNEFLYKRKKQDKKKQSDAKAKSKSEKRIKG